MGQCEWLSAICDYWGCSLSTARRYVKAFGGEVRKYVKRDIDEAEKRINHNINESTDRIISVMREEIAEQKKLILDCNKEKAELIREIEALKETINKQKLEISALERSCKEKDEKLNSTMTKSLEPFFTPETPKEGVTNSSVNKYDLYL